MIYYVRSFYGDNNALENTSLLLYKEAGEVCGRLPV